jgi:hypothetical protein
MTEWVHCLWTCAACRRDGTVRVWRYRGEEDEATAKRFAMQTRTRCVDGCRYTAVPGERERQVGRRGGTE